MSLGFVGFELKKKVSTVRMKVSIAMATYNGEEHLQAQLDSFVAQTRQPDELVVTDDCSTDDTPAILKSFAASAPFKVIYDRNPRTYGYAGNFNQALLKTTGDLVFLSDQDDVWFPEKLERIAAITAEDPRALVVMNDAALTDADLSDTGLTKLGQINSAGLMESAFVMGCCAAVKRDLLDLCLPVPYEFWAHDSWIVQIAEQMGRRRIVGEVLQYYRRHGANQSLFIANRTSRVTRMDVLFSKLEDAAARIKKMPESSINRLDRVLSSQLVMLEWVRVTSMIAPDPYASELSEFEKKLWKNVSLLNERDAMRQLSVFRRAAQAIRFWRNGGYEQFSGVKSLVSDILSR